MSVSLRALAASVWAGWYREFGWTNPAGSFVIRTLPPVASVLALVLIYGVGQSTAGFPADPSRLAMLLVGGALFAHIAAYSWVATLAIAEGKWTYVFQSVFISPKSATPYLAGRTLASFITSAITTSIALIVGYFVASALFRTAIPFTINLVTISLFVVALVVNILASMGLGFMLGAYSIYSTKFEWALPTYISGLMMLFSGAIFPIALLHHPISDIAGALPFTNFINASRDALIPYAVQQQTGAAPNYAVDLGYSLIGGLIFLAVGLYFFRRAENHGRRKGVLDRKAV